MQAVSDEQLIAWIAAGDHSCLGALFERHHRAVYNFCLKMTGNRDASEDIVQETFMKMLRSSRAYRADGSFRSWMFRISRNLIYDHMRQNKHQQPLDEDGFASEADPAEELDQANRGRLLARALDMLPTSVREVIWLGRFQLDSFEELGRTLDCSTGTARVRMHRAVKQLQVIVNKLEEDASHA